MEVPAVDQNNLKKGGEDPPPSTVTPNWTIDVSDVRTVKVSNVSLVASEIDIREFFSFSGDVEYVETRRIESERSQIAYVTFKDSQGADTALLLSGATIADLSISITPCENYQLPPEAYAQITQKEGLSATAESAVRKAEEVVSTMLAKGFAVGKDALRHARSFDERHRLLSSASATAASLDRRMGLSDKFSTGTAVVGSKVREVGGQLGVSEKARSAIAAAEQTAAAVMSSRYVSAGAAWLSGAIGAVARTAGEVGSMTREKVEKAEVQRRET
uniref:RRM domain-containing protein n=1 Tax=Ananas comosus var. bracteatus TaxID=296719 RepID=A0A6V7NUX5_ANACO|nr:unnamed protein product [Ananas comosus var. bracteatus]